MGIATLGKDVKDPRAMQPKTNRQDIDRHSLVLMQVPNFSHRLNGQARFGAMRSRSTQWSICMLPLLSSQDPTDDRLGDVVEIPQALLGDPAFCVALPHGKNVCLGELGTSVTYSGSATSLGCHVRQILRSGAKKKMVGPDTARGIAVVTDEYAARDGSMSQFIGHTMRHEGLTMELQSSIAFKGDTSRPQPTPDGRLRDCRKEMFIQGLHAGWLHTIPLQFVDDILYIISLFLLYLQG